MHADKRERLCVFQKPTSKWTDTEWTVLWRAAQNGGLTEVVYEGEGRIWAGRGHSFHLKIVVPVWDPSMVRQEHRFVERPTVPSAQGGVSRRQRRKKKGQRTQGFVLSTEDNMDARSMAQVERLPKGMAANLKGPSAAFVAFLKREKEKEVDALVESFTRAVQREADRRRAGLAWRPCHMENVRRTHEAAAIAAFEREEFNAEGTSLSLGGGAARSLAFVRGGTARPVGHAPRGSLACGENESVEDILAVGPGEGAVPEVGVEPKEEEEAVPILGAEVKDEALPVSVGAGPSRIMGLPEISAYDSDVIDRLCDERNVV